MHRNYVPQQLKAASRPLLLRCSAAMMAENSQSMLAHLLMLLHGAAAIRHAYSSHTARTSHHSAAAAAVHVACSCHVVLQLLRPSTQP
jgi:hypothetical protein